MFPDAARLHRLLDYLSIAPQSDVAALEDIQIIEPGGGQKLSQESLNKIDHIRKAIYSGNNYQQIGLFHFRVGLLLMENGWYVESAENFGKAKNQWGFLPERPNICLANFAKGVAHHRARQFDLAKAIYSEVEQQVRRIRNDVNVPSSIPQIKKYQTFVSDLTAQLQEAQKTVTRDIFHDLSPRIHPSLQTDSQKSSASYLLDIDQDILRENIQTHLNLIELQALCFSLMIDFNGLYGEGMATKSRELVAYCVRNRQLPDLLRELSRRNPSISWDRNVLQPNPYDIVEGEIIDRADSEAEENPEPLVAAEDSAEEEIVFSRSRERGVQFSDERLVAVNVEVAGSISDFSLKKQDEFIHFIAAVTDVNPDQITIQEVNPGSVKITINIPFWGARVLIDLFLKKNALLLNFRITNINLGQDTEVAPSQGYTQILPKDLHERIQLPDLRTFIFLYFNDSELRDLYFDLEVDYDSLPGEGKRDKAREIVAFCKRQNKLNRLIELCQVERPKAFSDAFLLGSILN